jgi:hypothetical protein
MTTHPGKLHRTAALVCLAGSIVLLIYLCAMATTDEMRYVAGCAVACASFAFLNVLALDQPLLDDELIKSLASSSESGSGTELKTESTDVLKKRK